VNRGDRSRWRATRALIVLAPVAALAACAELPRHAILPAMEIATPEFRATLEAYAAAPVVDGNAVEVLLNGDEIFPAQLAAIRSAQRTITFAQYYWTEGAIAAQTRDALAERCRAGVAANLLFDWFGSLRMPKTDRALLEEAGCQVALFRPPGAAPLGRLNHRNHRRILVVDGRVGITGGSGISDRWKGNGRDDGRWRDTDVRVEGPVVSQLQRAFAETWLEATGVALAGPAYFPAATGPAGDVSAQVVASSPALGDFAMYTTLTFALISARRSIYITNPYFLPDEPTIATLMSAARRGVRVVVLVPGQIDHNLVRQASRGEYGRLLRAGIEVYEYGAALLHAKTIVVDGVWSSIGSANFDMRSLALNAELNLLVYGPDVARELERIFVEDLAHARRVDLAGWRARPIWQRLLEWVAAPLRDQL
jgi:cardiolipin synthase